MPRGPGLSIKGAAARFTLEASNFAPGTTVPDIEASLQAIVTEANDPIEIISCRFTSTIPTIIAEIVFPEKAMADAVIKTFNGLLADGRILHIHYKNSSSRSAPKNEPTPISEPTPNASKDLFDTAPVDVPVEDAMEDVDMPTEPAAYSDERDRSDRERRDRDRDREREPRHEGDDEQARGDRNGGRRDERDRDRERERDRDHDRERDRGHDSRRYDDRRYERRDDRGSSSRGYGPPGGFDHRGGRPYGNGMGFPRDSGYNDGMMGGPRGGFRGGYRGFGRGRGF